MDSALQLILIVVLAFITGTATGCLAWWLWLQNKRRQITGTQRLIHNFDEVKRDITARKQTEAALQASADSFAKVFRASPIGISITELKHGTLFDVNPAILEMTGYARYEVIGKTARELNIWHDYSQRDEVTKALQRQSSAPRESTQWIEAVFRKRSGELFDVLVAGEQIELGGMPCIVLLVQDNTERKHTADELRRVNAALEERVAERTAALQYQQATLSAVLDGMGEGVFYEQAGIIRYANHSLTQLTGYPLEELIGQRSSMLTGALLPVPADAQPQRLELLMKCKDGSAFDAALTLTMLTDPDTASRGVITLVRDITEEKQLQAQKSVFMANASHELRTPLTVLKTRLYILRRQPANLPMHLDVLERVTEQMIGLVEDLLDISRFERGIIPMRREDVILQDVITEIVQMQHPEAQRKGISLTAELPTMPVRTRVDPPRLTQALLNLVSNAVNYTPENGQVVVTLVVQPDESESFALIRVQDTGIGIAAEHLDAVFQPFFRVNEYKARGTGLGLPIAKSIIEQHGGTLTVESIVGQGSTFTVRLALPD